MKFNKHSLVHQLVLMAIMAAINVIFTLISTHLLLVSFFLILFLPLTSVVVALNVDLKKYPIYIIATTLLSLILNFNSIESTLFFLFPLLISGLTFGILIRYRENEFLTIFLVTLTNFLLMIASIPLLNFLYEVDFKTVLMSALGFSNPSLISLLFPLLITLLSFAQTIITFLILNLDSGVLKIDYNRKYWPFTPFLALILLALTTAVMFFSQPLALVLLFFATFATLILLFELFAHHLKIAVITLIVVLTLTPIASALFHSFTPIPFYFGIIIPLFFIVIIAVLWLYINSKKKEKLHD